MGTDRGETALRTNCNDQYLILEQNAFTEKLGPLGLDAFRMLVVDFMHECELGTWKALFTHLIRLLYALPGGDSLVASLDHRFVVRLFSCIELMTLNSDFAKFHRTATVSFADSPITRRK